MFGASRSVVFREHFREVLVMTVISLVLAVFVFSVYYTTLTRYFSWLPETLLFDYKLLILLAVVLIIVVFSSAIYPSVILSSGKPVNLLNKYKGSGTGRFGLVNVLVVIQFVLCITLFSSTLFMQRQIDYLEKQLIDLSKQSEHEQLQGLEEIFSPLHNSHLQIFTLRKSKAKSTWLRIYALRIDKNVYLTTGGTIKLTQKMQDRKHTMTELNKIESCRNFLLDQGIVDVDGVIEEIESQNNEYSKRKYK